MSPLNGFCPLWRNVLLLFSLWQLVYVSWMAAMLATGRVDQWGTEHVVLHLMTMAGTFVAFIYYARRVLGSPTTIQQKIAWLVVLWVFAPVAMPVFLFRQMRLVHLHTSGSTQIGQPQPAVSSSPANE